MIFALITLILLLVNSGADAEIPATFSIGVGSSAYQSEGAWNEDGKGPSVWDTLVHSHPELISNRSDGDVACDSYHLWKQDLINAGSMGSNHYRFSISWSRLLPYGTPEYINPFAVDYYYQLIHMTKSHRMEPYVTMYHWDLPEPLQNKGGWLNPEIVNDFVNYARVLIELFGLSVTYWISIDDPLNFCVNTYDLNEGAPLVETSPGLGCYLCAKHMLLAHAKVYRMRKEDYITRNCAIGIAINAVWAEPKSNTTQEDVEAADREMEMTLHWFTDPLIDGDYPALMKSRIASLSEAGGFAESRLPLLTDDEIKLIKGAFGFLGINYFHSYLISPAQIADSDPPSFQRDKGTVRGTDPGWGRTGHPLGLRSLLRHLKAKYYNPRIILTAVGYGNEDEDIEDEDRSEFFRQSFRQTIDALNDDFCQVDGFTAWSLMDQMEWRNGYKLKYGLFHVDFNDPNKKRTQRISGEYYDKVASLRIV